jgi:hypothetical protein
MRLIKGRAHSDKLFWKQAYKNAEVVAGGLRRHTDPKIVSQLPVYEIEEGDEFIALCQLLQDRATCR